MKTRSLLCFALGVIGMCPAALSAPSDTLGLLGLSASDLVAKLGNPEKIDGDPAFSQFYDYPGGLKVSLSSGTVTLYLALSDAAYASEQGIKVGASLDEVVAAYGAVTESVEVSGWSDTSKEQVLYHDSETDRYKLNYQSSSIAFLLDSEKRVQSIWVSESFGKE
jgi:hypothetical protein